MSVLNIKRRFTKNKEIFTANTLSRDSYLYLDGNESNVSEFSLDLSLGDGWNENYSDSDNRIIEVDGKVVLKPNSSIVVEVSQNITVPNNMYGLIVSTGSLFLTRGVLVTSAKVEPAFSGNLKLRLVNTTKVKVEIFKDEKLASVIFFPTEITTVQTGFERRKLAKRTVPKREKIMLFIKAHGSDVFKYYIFPFILFFGTTYGFMIYPQKEKINQQESDIRVFKQQIDALSKKIGDK